MTRRMIQLMLLFATVAVLQGCVVLAGAAAGGAVGWVAGHEAGERGAKEEIRNTKGENDE